MILGMVLLLSVAPAATEPSARADREEPTASRPVDPEAIDPDGSGCLAMHLPFTLVDDLEPEVDDNFWAIYIGHLFGGETCGSAWVAPLMVGYFPDDDFFTDAGWTFAVHMAMYYLSYCLMPCPPCFVGAIAVNKLWLFPIASINTYNHHLKVAKAKGAYRGPPPKPERKKWIPPAADPPAAPVPQPPADEKKPTPPPAAPGPAPKAAPPAPDSFEPAPGEAPDPDAPADATPPADDDGQPALEDSPAVRIEAPAESPAPADDTAEPGFGGDDRYLF